MNKDTLERLRETVLVPHGDPQLALYAKLVVGLLWLVHLPLGFLYGAPLPFYLLLGGMMLLDGVNLSLSRRSASRARELGAALAFLAGSALLFQKAYVGYFKNWVRSSRKNTSISSCRAATRPISNCAVRAIPISQPT